jgi:hypothetical protein
VDPFGICRALAQHLVVLICALPGIMMPEPNGANLSSEVVEDAGETPALLDEKSAWLRVIPAKSVTRRQDEADHRAGGEA